MDVRQHGGSAVRVDVRVAKAMVTQEDTVKSIAYGVLCHASAKRVADQFRYIWSPDCFCFYHVDRKAPDILHGLTMALQTAYDNVFVVPSMWCSWGGFSLVEAMLALTNAAVRQGGNWSHFVFLSEQHLPLVSHQDILNTLETGESYVQRRGFREIDPHGQDDLMHRFEAEYREIPGVGGFRAKPREPRSDFIAELWHGSQWMVLSRPACELLSLTSRDLFRNVFSTSLLPDETAIQTWFAHSDNLVACRNQRRNLTFVASPSVGGSDDMTFRETNFFDAIRKGYLFIRKRPDVLPQSVHDHLNKAIPSASRVRILARRADKGVAEKPGIPR